MNTQKPDVTPVDEIVKNFDLPPVPQRFPAKLMRKQGELLGQAGDLLSHAYATANSIAAIATVVRRSQIARELDDEVLTSCEEDHLLAAVTLLAEQLSETLCNAADRFGDELSKGGA